MVTFPRLAMLLALALCSLPAAATSCHVVTRTSGELPPPVVTEKCFEYQGLDSGAIDWVCQNTEGVKNSRRERVESCPAGHFATCTATATPATLANERAVGSQATDVWSGTVSEQARIVTYVYEASDRSQAKIDCESAGGEWSQ